MLKLNEEILVKTNIILKYYLIIQKLSNTNSIVLNKDKGRGIVIMYRSAYLENCFT